MATSRINALLLCLLSAADAQTDSKQTFVIVTYKSTADGANATCSGPQYLNISGTSGKCTPVVSEPGMFPEGVEFYGKVDCEAEAGILVSLYTDKDCTTVVEGDTGTTFENDKCTGGTIVQCLKPAEPPSATSTIIALVQTGFFFLMGPVVLLYGPVVMRVVIFMQSLFASNYVLFIATFSTVSVDTIWDTFSKAVFLAAGTITLAFASIKGKKIQGVARGAVLGILVGTPLMEFVTVALFQNWAGCSMTGEKTPNFPNGSPEGCPTELPEGMPYVVSFHVCKGVNWVIIFVFAKVGQALVGVGSAMTGATMFLSALLDLVSLILNFIDPTIFPMIATPISAVRAFATYGLAGIGVICQRLVLTTEKDPKTGEKKSIKRKKGDAKFCNCLLSGFFGLLLTVVSKLDDLIKAGMEGNGLEVKMPDLENMEGMEMSEEMKEKMKKAAIKKAMDAAKPIVDPILKKILLDYDAIKPMVDDVDTLEEAQAVAKDPVPFLNKHKGTLIPIVVSNVGPFIDPHLAKLKIKFDMVKDKVVPLVEKYSQEDFGVLMQKLQDPEALLEELKPEIKAAVIASAGEQVDPELKKIGLNWKDDVVPMVEKLDSLKKIQEFVTGLMAGPEEFILSKQADLKEKIEAGKAKFSQAESAANNAVSA